MAEACERVIGILDGTKWHRSALLTFVAADDVDAIVTDSSAPIDQVEAWRARGTEVVTAEVKPRERSPIRTVDLRRPIPSDGTRG
jgi:DeoR/GlpR family transcriptional regulator of sugar metabolism